LGFFQRLAGSAAALVGLACGGEDLVLPHDSTPTAITAIPGTPQTGTVASALADSLVVRVTDEGERPMAGVSVEFAVQPAGSDGAVAPATAVTGSDGQARAQWTLGRLAGSQTVDARVVGAEQVAVTFTAAATADVANAIAALSGDGQSATVGTALADSLVVRVTDQFGNPVGGVAVDWSADPGSIAPGQVATDADGRAAARRVLGAVAGAQTAAASSAGLVGSPVTFTITGTPGTAASLVLISGDGQSAAAGSQLPDPVVVRLVDAQGNPLEHGAVAWVVGAGGGSVTPGSGETDRDGFASARWTMGSSAGSNTLSAVASGVGIVTFTATATGGGGGGGGGGGDPGNHLVFQVQPSDAREKERITPAVVVGVVDRNGVPLILTRVKIELELVAGSGKLEGKLERETQNGFAVFDDLKVDEPGDGKVLRAAARDHPELGTVESRTFRIEEKD
jgi:hypothetical protein